MQAGQLALSRGSPHSKERRKSAVAQAGARARCIGKAYAELDAHRRRLKIGKPRLLMVDGFAGPGRYVGGRRDRP